MAQVRSIETGSKFGTGKGNLLPLGFMAKPLLMSTESVFYTILLCDVVKIVAHGISWKEYVSI